MDALSPLLFPTCKLHKHILLKQLPDQLTRVFSTQNRHHFKESTDPTLYPLTLTCRLSRAY